MRAFSAGLQVRSHIRWWFNESRDWGVQSLLYFSGTKEGDRIKSFVEKGAIVPTELTVGLLLKAVRSRQSKVSPEVLSKHCTLSQLLGRLISSLTSMSLKKSSLKGSLIEPLLLGVRMTTQRPYKIAYPFFMRAQHLWLICTQRSEKLAL